jgi:hypothetical protein
MDDPLARAPYVVLDGHLLRGRVLPPKCVCAVLFWHSASPSASQNPRNLNVFGDPADGTQIALARGHMPTSATIPSLIDDSEFLAELEGLDGRHPAKDDDGEPGGDRERPDDRRLWQQRLHERRVFTDLEAPDAAGLEPARVSVAVTVLVLLMCAAAGAGAAALVFQDRLAQILR